MLVQVQYNQSLIFSNKYKNYGNKAVSHGNYYYYIYLPIKLSANLSISPPLMGTDNRELVPNNKQL